MTIKKKKKIIKLLGKVDNLLAEERNEGGYYHKQMIAEWRIKIQALEEKIRRN